MTMSRRGLFLAGNDQTIAPPPPRESTVIVDHIMNRDNLHVKEVTSSDESQQIRSKINNLSPIQKGFVIFA